VRKTLHKQTNRQTDRQTDKPTDTTKIMVTWPWTNSRRYYRNPWYFTGKSQNAHRTWSVQIPHTERNCHVSRYIPKRSL